MNAPSSSEQTANGPLGLNRAVVLPGIVVFVFALVVRWLYLTALQETPYFDFLLVDAQWHDQWAWDWARGEWSMGDKAFFRAPLYPFWLSRLYQVFGHDLLAVRIVEMVVGGFTCLLIGGSAYRIAGKAAFWVAGIMAALYGPMIFFGAELLIPNLLLFLLSLWFFLSLGTSLKSQLIAALCLGLAIVARPNALALLPVALFLAHRSSDVARFRWAQVLGIALVPALFVTGLNMKTEGDFVFVASQGGVNFAAGNHDFATGRSVELPGFESIANWKEFLERSKSLAESREGRELTSGEISRHWFGQGLSWLTANPGKAAVLYGKKLYFLFHAHETANNRDLYFQRPGPLKFLLFSGGQFSFPWGVVFPLAVFGLISFWKRDSRIKLLGLWVLLYGFSLLPFFISGRFRMGMVPALILLASLGFLELWKRPHPLKLVIPVLVFLVVNSSFLNARVSNRGQELTKLGALYLEQGNFIEGLKALEEAVTLEPNDVSTNYLLGDAYLERGRFDLARVHFERLVSQRTNDGRVYFSLGVCYLATENFDLATRAFEAAAELQPEDAATWINLGAAREGQGEFAAAVDAYKRGLVINPRAEIGYMRLALLWSSRGLYENAVITLTEAVQNIQNSYPLRAELTKALIATGDYVLAQEQIDMALHMNPEDPEGLAMQEWLSKELAKRKPGGQ